MKGVVALIILIFTVSSLIGQDIVINEFMAINNTTIQDEDGDYSDWIELYNSSNSAVSLLNFRLSDDQDELNKWTFPDIDILPNSYLLVFASGKDRLDLAELHTNFKISSSGEELFLSNSSGVIQDQTNAVNLSGDKSYGRIPDGSANWIVINTPTPNGTNNSSDDLIFSNPEGFYTSSFPLKIVSLVEGTIYYTLNGDIPTESSSVFGEDLIIDDRSSEPNVVSENRTTPEQEQISYKAWESPSQKLDKATILRCATYFNGVRTSKIYTKTFFVGDDIYDKYTVPIISLVTDEASLFHQDSGIYVPGVYYNDSNPEWTGNYYMRGREWERNVHVEYFENDGRLGFSQDAGVRIHGGKTRQASQKSLRLYARNDYGEKYFNYQLLPQKPVDKYKRFILRTTMGAWGGQTIIKDVLGQNISSSLDLDYQEFQPVIVYLNGEYWGVQTIRDRLDERYVEYTHGIDENSVEFKDWGNLGYRELMLFVDNNDLKDNSNYEYVKSQLDVNNFIDYTIAEMFFTNIDWPKNNVSLWREMPVGKWRYVLYDLDAGFWDIDLNMFERAAYVDTVASGPDSQPPTFLLRKLWKNDAFQSQFINRYAELLNNEFDTRTMVAKLSSIQEVYSPEIDGHIGRWNYPDSLNRWKSDIRNDLLYFIENRPCVVRENIMAFFDLTEFDFDCNGNDGGDDKDDHLILAPNPNNGNFYLLNDAYDLAGATVRIIGMNGQEVYKEDNIDLLKNERMYLNFPSLPSNIYLLQVKSYSYSGQKKIVIID